MIFSAFTSLAISLVIYSMMLDLLVINNVFLTDSSGGDYLGWLFMVVYALVAAAFYTNYQAITKYIFRNKLIKFLFIALTYLVIFIYTESGVVFKLLSIRNSESYKSR